MSLTTDGEAKARRAIPSDADHLARFRWRWRAVERGESGDWERFRADFARWVAEHEDTHIPFLVEAEGEPVGMAWLAVVERVPGPQHWRRVAGMIQSVYVVAEQRNRGLGTLLVGELIGFACAEGLDYLAVHPSERSFPFYRRLGFSGTERVLELDFRDT